MFVRICDSIKEFVIMIFNHIKDIKRNFLKEIEMNVTIYVKCQESCNLANTLWYLISNDTFTVQILICSLNY